MNRKLIFTVLAIAIIFTAVLNFTIFSDIEKKGKNLIRFHVQANSDSPEDQLLKSKIRDKVIAYMAPYFAAVTDVEESRQIIRTHLKDIEKIAREEIVENWKYYPVTVNLDEQAFPTKRYGDNILPAGNYEALIVVIGEGKGQNWWCVMFPPLCFIDVKNGLIDEKTNQQLKAALTEEEYAVLHSAANEKEQLPLQLKSKIAEWLQSSKSGIQRLASLF